MTRLSLGALICALSLAPSLVAASAKSTCAAMQRDDRLGPMSYEQCLCSYGVAEDYLDADIKALLFESWSTGKNNMETIEKLKPRRRVRKQIEGLAVRFQKECGS